MEGKLRVGRPRKNSPYPYSRPGETSVKGYGSWPVVAGFFDGDGSAEEKVGRFTANVKIGFTDNWDKQLMAVRNFLRSENIRAGSLTQKKFKRRLSAWQMRISNLDGVLRASKEMLPYAFKKKAELRAIVDYLEDRTTGDELIRRVNREVEIGNKVGVLKTAKLPYTRSEGVRLKIALNLEKAHTATRIVVPEAEQLEICREHYTNGMSIVELSKAYRYSKSVIQRVLETR